MRQKWGNRFSLKPENAEELAGIVRCMEANARECGCTDYVVYRHEGAIGWCSPQAALSELKDAEVLSHG